MQPPDAGQPRLRVVVADDQAIVREGLVTLLGLMPDIDVVAAAADGDQAVALTAEHDPDVVLMDLGMPRVDGVTATARIRQNHPRTQVVVLTTLRGRRCGPRRPPGGGDRIPHQGRRPD